LQGGSAVSNATGKKHSEWFNRGYTNIPVADRFNASMPFMTVGAGQALCGTDGWTNDAIALSTDASY